MRSVRRPRPIRIDPRARTTNTTCRTSIGRRIRGDIVRLRRIDIGRGGDGKSGLWRTLGMETVAAARCGILS